MSTDSELDPELVSLRPKQRFAVGAVAAGGITLLALFLIWKLASDLTYSRAGAATALSPTDVRGLATLTRFDNRPVKLVGAPTNLAAEFAYPRALRVGTSEGGVGMRAIPLRGANDRLWVLVDGDSRAAIDFSNEVVGRARRLASLPLGQRLRAYASKVAQPVFVKLDAVGAATSRNVVTTVDGDLVEASAATPVVAEQRVPGKAQIDVTLNERLPSEAAWRAALAQANIDALATAGAESGTARFIASTAPELAPPQAVADIQGRLERANLWAADVSPVTLAVVGTWADVTGPATHALSLDRLKANGDTRLLRLEVMRPIPPDAMIVLVGEVPADYWYVLPVIIALAGVALLFGWAFLRALKRDYLVPRAALRSASNPGVRLS